MIFMQKVFRPRFMMVVNIPESSRLNNGMVGSFLAWFNAGYYGVYQFWYFVGSRDLLSQTYLANLKDVFVKHDLELATNIVYSGCHIGRFVE